MFMMICAASVLAACTSHKANESGETTASSTTPDDDTPAPLQPVAFDGDCSLGPPIGRIEAYAGASATLIRNSWGVRVRSCPVWPVDDLRNVLGVLPPGQRIPVFGPTKYELFSAGIGYVVPLVDPRGVQCRGYVSQTVLDRIDRHSGTNYREALPLPSPVGGRTGPCLLTEADTPPPPMRVGYMWWYAGDTLDRSNPVMIATVRVASLRSRPSDSEHRPGLLIDATFDIHEVLYHRPAVATTHRPNAYDYAGETTMEIGSLNPLELAVGDMLLIFLISYEANYALAGVIGTNSPIGIRLEGWDDEIVDLARRFGAETLSEQAFYAAIERLGRRRGWDR